MKTVLLTLFLASGLAAGCATATAETPADARRGLAFARERCAACHAVAANMTSLNPEAAPFEDIANRPGLTDETLRAFLRDSHNFPAAMNFAVDPGHIADLSAWIVTLRQEGYRPTQ